MTFSMYHSLSPPRSSTKRPAPAAHAVQRFWRLDVPHSMIPLVWIGMMSFGGAWFLPCRSEAITVGPTPSPAGDRQLRGRRVGEATSRPCSSRDGDVPWWSPSTPLFGGRWWPGPSASGWRRPRRGEAAQPGSTCSGGRGCRPAARPCPLGGRSTGPRDAPSVGAQSATVGPAPAGRRRPPSPWGWAVVFAGGPGAGSSWTGRSASRVPPTAIWLGSLTFFGWWAVLPFSTVCGCPWGEVGLSAAASPVRPSPSCRCSPGFRQLPVPSPRAVRGHRSGSSIGGIVLMALGALWYLLFNATRRDVDPPPICATDWTTWACTAGSAGAAS